uniref:Uncharacterized protein n=1 Tax=Anopheles funestus TaxID=62324 RepID=A0A182RWV1_ANOFN
MQEKKFVRRQVDSYGTKEFKTLCSTILGNILFVTLMSAVNEISLNLFVDGLPLRRSGPTELWPIMIQLHEPLATDLTDVLENGIFIHNNKINVIIRAFIADSPARAFIKGVANYNAANGCIKCKILGERVRNRLIFEGVAAERTDAEFRSGKYSIGHQKQDTPLLDVPGFDMVRTITVADDLHILHLGIMKRLLQGYVEGSMEPVLKWTLAEQKEMSFILVNTQLPVEIPRHIGRGSNYALFLTILMSHDSKGESTMGNITILSFYMSESLSES